MSFQRPSIQQILSRIQADIESRLPGSNPRLRHNLLDILARMQTGVAHGIYGELEWLAKNLLPDTSDPEILARWADIVGVPQLAATVATGNVTVTGSNGSVVPSGALFVGSNGADYVLSADVTIAGSAGVGIVDAAAAGAAGNLSTGSSLILQSPIAGVSSTAIVASPGLAAGADIETVDAWRERLLARLRMPPQGGAFGDYILWARAAHAAVTDVWVFPAASGPGTVTVLFMTYGTTANGIPSPAVIADVEAYIDVLRPVTAAVTVAAPTAQALDITISNLTPNTQAVRDAVVLEINNLLIRSAPGVNMPLSVINEVISRAIGETDHVLDAPASNVVVPAGAILVPGTFTWL